MGEPGIRRFVKSVEEGRRNGPCSQIKVNKLSQFVEDPTAVI